MTQHSASAALAVPFATASVPFRTAAEARGTPIEEGEGRLKVTFQFGTITLTGDGAVTALRIHARDQVGLQLLRDGLAERVRDIGAGLDWDADLTGRRPANQSLATVTEVTRLSPSYMRLVLEGPDLARLAEGGYHFRLLFGPDGAGWPVTDAGGVTQWPGGAEAWHRPVYTARELHIGDGGAARIVFDVFIHEGGRTTDWARRVSPGTEIAITGPGGGKGPGEAGWYLLVGDETAVPVMARVLARLPATAQGRAVLFVPQAADRQDLQHPPGIVVDWILRGGDLTPLSVVQEQTLPAADRFVYVATERSEAIAARQYLSGIGLTKAEMLCASYWTAPAA
ncbi:siderophore-interacting protein [Pseudooceanicola onchidii]|uniref:siderophore-interacting protein n=1 Tax=Pseudooceanicola onchidii TaxID=2562279 RepID=UPI0010AAE703|nr:siderophore-interacting protein [Pseudooceanicola onchidii]